MHEQRSDDERPEAEFSEPQVEKAVIDHLLVDRLPWTVEELVRECSCDRLATIDAIASLVGVGLVHRLGEFVFPTRTARRADEIEL